MILLWCMLSMDAVRMPLPVQKYRNADFDSNTSLYIVSIIHMMDRHGNECLLSNQGYFEYGTLLLLTSGYAASSLHREWC